MPRVVDRCRNGDAVVTAEYCTRALYGAIINMQRMKFEKFSREDPGLSILPVPGIRREAESTMRKTLDFLMFSLLFHADHAFSAHFHFRKYFKKSRKMKQS